MAIPKKGSRKINVDGRDFLWRVRSKPTYSQALGWANMTISVTLANQLGASTLMIHANFSRPDAWIPDPDTVPITPAMVAHSIKQALRDGWAPTQSGTAFEVALQIA
jgi:hypothetical protein